MILKKQDNTVCNLKISEFNQIFISNYDIFVTDQHKVAIKKNKSLNSSL